jgi:prepilin-type N-terminal cleavage/methylation domain-containing protein
MRRRAAGFTLIEIAVAMAILGAGVVTLQQIYQGALRLQERSSRRSRVVLHARAAMDALLVAREVKDHTEERTTQEGFKTRELVRDATVDEGGEDTGSEFGLHSLSEQKLKYLEVEVAWQDGTGRKTYTLRSLRMAPDEGGFGE